MGFVGIGGTYPSFSWILEAGAGRLSVGWSSQSEASLSSCGANWSEGLGKGLAVVLGSLVVWGSCAFAGAGIA
jgi:hypothetical protein